MITFETDGKLGNNLFQYAIARLLSESLGYKLGTEINFGGTLTTTKSNPGYEYTNDKIVVDERISEESPLENRYEKRHYHLKGFWQNSDYYIPNRDRILGYFNEKATRLTDRSNIIMHVRLSDYKIFGHKNGNVLHPQYYLDCLARENFKNLFIVTDEPDDSYFEPFRKFNPIFPRGSQTDDFWTLTGFDRVIIGNSSFSWWAAFLSNATKIYAPSCWIRGSTPHNNLQNIGMIVPAGFIDYERGYA